MGRTRARCFLRLVVQSNSRRMRCFHIVGSLKLILKRRTCLRKRVAILAFCTTILVVSISPSQAQQGESDARARKMLTKVVPIYPSLAQKMGIAGSVENRSTSSSEWFRKIYPNSRRTPSACSGGCRGHSVLQVGCSHARDEGNRNFQFPS